MTVLTVSGISLSYGTDEILNDISFTVQEGGRVGIIGANGAGKTTLFNIICGRTEPTAGSVTFARGHSPVMLSQKTENIFGNTSVLEWALSSFSRLRKLEDEISLLEGKLPEGRPADLNRYALLSDEFKRSGGLEYRAKTQSMLERFGFCGDDLNKSTELLSGGQKTRLALLSVLLSDADVVLLDEPTNHLDLETAEWLEKFIAESRKTFLIISHDRYFLDRVTDSTLEIENTRAMMFNGSYSVFREKKDELRRTMMKHYLEQQKEIKRIEDFIENQRRWNRERNIRAAESRIKMLDRMEKLEKPDAPPDSVRFSFGAASAASHDVLSVRGICKSFGDNHVLNGLSFELKLGDRLFVTGANGSGKSTLIKILTSRLEADSGVFEFGYRIKTGYYDQEQQLIDDSSTVIEELWRENDGMTMSEIRTRLAAFGFTGDDVFKPNSVLSGGERARLSIAKLIGRGSDLLILDEPTNHLDINSREVLENALKEFSGTILCVSHDRFFISRLADRILELDKRRYESGFRLFEATYDRFLTLRPSLPESGTTSRTDAKSRSVPAQKDYALIKKNKKRLVIVGNEIERREKVLAQIKEKMNGEAGSDYIALAELEKQAESINAELSTLYEEYFSLDEQME